MSAYMLKLATNSNIVNFIGAFVVKDYLGFENIRFPLNFVIN